MTPDEIETMLRDHRPEPSPGLRERVLAAAACVERRPPWWARASTWSSAAAALLLCNWLIMADHGTPAAPTESICQIVVLSPEETAELPPVLVARLRQPLPPMRSNAPTPLTPIKDILR